jgi:hypothetical protein
MLKESQNTIETQTQVLKHLEKQIEQKQQEIIQIEEDFIGEAH